MFDLLVIGAGPSGLSCAIEARKAGLSVVVLDKGSLVDYIRRFPTNLIWFSTPELLEIGGVPFAISTVRPTREDTLAYYQKVVSQFELDIRYHDAVVAVTHSGGFTVTTTGNQTYRAKNVVVATGYFDHPNHLSVPGEDFANVFHYYNEPHATFGCDVAVVGGKNSAVEAALELYRHGARVTLIHRGPKLSDGVKYWILPDIENRLKSGQITPMFESQVQEFRHSQLVVQTSDGIRSVKADFSFVLIGFHPDTKFLRELGISVDPQTLAPAFNPETFETNVPGLFVAGSVVAGKNNNKVFVENGRLHGRVIVDCIRSKLH